MGRVGWKVVALACLAWICLGLARPAETQKPSRLKIDVVPLTKRARTGAPVRIAVKAKWKGSGVLRGFFEIDVRDVNEVYCRVRTEALALAAGSQTFDVCLPPMVSVMADGLAEVNVRFVGRKRRGNPVKKPIVLADPGHRNLVVGACRSEGTVSANPNLYRIGKSLFLERFDPDHQNVRGELPLRSHLAWIDAVDIPGNPLDWCFLDVVLLDAAGFGQLQHKQVNALIAWVEAGGSLCLLAGGPDRLRSYHVEGLNRLTGEAGPIYTRDRDGHVRTGVLPPHGMLLRHVELGRAAVIHEAIDPGKDLGSLSWRKMVCFLWKVRQRQLDCVVRTGQWGKSRSEGQYYSESECIWKPCADPTFKPLALDLEDFTLPSGIRLIPLEVLILILVLFILAVGPVDYFLLGLLRRRWLTWVLFPLTCVAFTILTVKVSNVYLGESDHVQALEFVDVGAGGRVLRRSRIEFLFPGQERMQILNLKRTLYSPLDAARQSGSETPGSGGAAGGWRSDEGPPRMAGRLTGHVEVHRKLWKWTPVAHRTLCLEAGGAETTLFWDGVNAGYYRGHGKEAFPGLKGLLDRKRFVGAAARDKVVLILAAHRSGLEAFLSRPLTPEKGTGEGGLTPEKLREIIEKISLRTGEAGWFEVVSGISPAGSGNFEDLAVLDVSSERQKLLVVVIREGNDFIVYRRLYTFGSR